MHKIIDLLISALGKSSTHTAFIELEAYLADFISVEQDEKIVLHSANEGLALTFDVNDVLIKSEMTAPHKWFQMWIEANLSLLEQPARKTDVIESLGPPTSVINHQQQKKGEEQILYNKNQFWVSLKFKDEQLVTVALLVPELISGSMRSNQVPVRTSHTKN